MWRPPGLVSAAGTRETRPTSRSEPPPTLSKQPDTALTRTKPRQQRKKHRNAVVTDAHQTRMWLPTNLELSYSRTKEEATIAETDAFTKYSQLEFQAVKIKP